MSVLLLSPVHKSWLSLHISRNAQSHILQRGVLFTRRSAPIHCSALVRRSRQKLKETRLTISYPGATWPPLLSTPFASNTSFLASSTPSRLLFSSPLLLYVRGVPYIYLLFLLPVLCYFLHKEALKHIEKHTRPSTLELIAYTALPIVFLAMFVGFTVFNRRLVRTIHLLPDRQVRITTMNMWRSQSYTHAIDTLIPPFAWTGTQGNALVKLQFVVPASEQQQQQPQQGQLLCSYYMHPIPNRAADADSALLYKILHSNRIQHHETLL